MPRKPQQLKATVTVDPFIGEGGIHLYLLKIQTHVFWCVGDEGDNSVSVLIGDDDEGWDVAVSLPPGIIDVIRREIAGCHL